MSLKKVARMVGLINVLSASHRPLGLDDIASRVGDYPDNPESFRRAFERDKSDLRNMGIDLHMAPIPGVVPEVVGYRILPSEFADVDFDLTAEELEALILASALVGTDSSGHRALLKLGAPFKSGQPQMEMPVSPDLSKVYTASSQRQRIEFVYNGQPRLVEPTRLSFLKGNWYLVGFDATRAEPRNFRLDRVEGEIKTVGEIHAFERRPSDQAVITDPWALGASRDPVDVTVRFDPEVAAAARLETRRGRVISDDESGLVVQLPVTNRDGFRAWVLSYLDRAEVVEPSQVRNEMITWLEEIVGG